MVSALVTWDSKVLTVVALLGGVGDFVRPKMKKDGIYGEFISITKVRKRFSFSSPNAATKKLTRPDRESMAEYSRT